MKFKGSEEAGTLLIMLIIGQVVVRKVFIHKMCYVLHHISEPSLLSIVDVVSTSTNITVTWSWPEELESNITGFIIQYRPTDSTEEFSNSTLIIPRSESGCAIWT